MEIFRRNKTINQKEIAANKTILESRPLRLMLVLTNVCNIKCIMCDRVRINKTSLSFTSAKKIFSLLPYLETIDIQGGELFLLDYFPELLCEFLKFKNLTTSLLTNGLLIDQKWADLLVRDNINLAISIDSVVSNTYEYIRKGAKFSDLLKSLDLIVELSKKRNIKCPLTTLNTVVMRSNYKELHLLPKFCRDYGFTRLTFDFLRPQIAPQEDIFMINSDSGAINYLKEILPKIESESKQLGIKPDFSCILPFLNDALDKQSISQQGAEQKICKIPWSKLFVDADGTIRPDCLCNQIIGDLNNVSSLEEVWNNQIMQTYRNRIINHLTDGWCSESCLIGAVGKQYRECT